MLALQQRRMANWGNTIPFNRAELELLLTAASAQRADGFYGDGMVAIYDAIATCENPVTVKIYGD